MSLAGASQVPHISQTVLLYSARLQLDHNSLHGNLTSLANLPRLEHLHLEDNSFTGPIPTEMSALTNLKMLKLGGNDGMTGTIPVILGEALTSLQELNLQGTGVKGSIPASLSQLESLGTSNCFQGDAFCRFILSVYSRRLGQRRYTCTRQR
jgi:Leucine-rich repeat (LRR) protein